MMWSSQRKSQINIGQVGRHQRRIIDSASVRRAYDDDQRPLGAGPGVVRGRSPLTPSGVVYSVFKNKTPKLRTRVLEGPTSPTATNQNCTASRATQLPFYGKLDKLPAVINTEVAVLMLYVIFITTLVGYLLHVPVCLA